MILIGASGHGKVILDILSQNEVDVLKVLDDNPSKGTLLGVPILKYSADLLYENCPVIISIGNNCVRKYIAETRLHNYVSAAHPKSTISPFAVIGEGTVVMANTTINPDAKIGKHCIINTGAVIEHDCKLGDYVHISPNAALAGNVTVGECSHIGIGAVVIQGIAIGKNVTVGAGAVIIRDVPNDCTVVGNPAKIIKKAGKH